MKSTIQAAFKQLVQKPLLLFLFFWLIIVLLCLPAFEAGFNRDFEGLLYYYHHHSFWDFINRSGFSVKSFYQITQLQLYAFISLWGLNPLPWFLILTSLHATNATLIFTFCKRLFYDFNLPNALTIAFIGSFLFLTNPSITEVTIWKGGYHYLTAILAQTFLLLFTQSYLKNPKNKYVLYIIMLFAISSFTLELFYLSPWYCLILIYAYYWKGFVVKQKLKDVVSKVFLPQLLIFVAHLLVFRIYFGFWVSHYGTTDGLRFDYETILPRLLKYLASILFFTAHSTNEFAADIFAICERPIVYYSFYAILLIVVVIIFSSFKKMNSHLQLASIFLGMMVLSAAIILPINFDNGMQIYNSRFSYQFSIPVYMMLSICAFLMVKKMRIVAISLLLYAAIGMGFAFRKAIDWGQASRIQKSLLSNYKWQNKKQVLILNFPCYYKDISIIPSCDQNEFQEYLMVFGQDTCKYPTHFVSSYNMNSKWDGAHVLVQDSFTIKVRLNQWGSWWMYNLGGAADRETDDYKLEMTDVGHEYVLHLKKPINKFIILYLKEDKWVVADNTMGEINVQW